MTDEDIEKIIKRNMNLQMNLAGIRADFEEASQRQWEGLNWDDLPEIYVGDIAFLHGAKWAEAKLKEKNNG